MPKLVAPPDTDEEEEIRYSIRTPEAMDIARKRVGASCQLVLDLYERLQGKHLKPGSNMQDITGRQNGFIEIADHLMDVVAHTHDSHELDSDVRKADHEVSTQMCLILTYLIKAT